MHVGSLGQKHLILGLPDWAINGLQRRLSPDAKEAESRAKPMLVIASHGDGKLFTFHVYQGQGKPSVIVLDPKTPV
jgi:hypothetical protein